MSAEAKRGLGRGLSALLGESAAIPTAPPARAQRHLPIGQLALLFRVCTRDMAAATFTYMPLEEQKKLLKLLTQEQAAALLVRGAREMTRQSARPLCVEFMYGRPNAPVDYEGVLGCPVRFQAKWDAVVFSEETLRLRVVDADNKLLRVLEAACR